MFNKDMFAEMFGDNNILDDSLKSSPKEKAELPKTYLNAYQRITKGEFFEDKSVLKLCDEFGWSIAHIQAHRGWDCDEKDILNLVDKNGKSVRNIIKIRRL